MFYPIWQKEVRERLYTWKGTVWLILAALVFSLTSYLLLTNKELSLLDQTELLWLLSKIIVVVSLVIVVIDASLVINTEFERETAESLFLTPLLLSDFVLGKFLATMTLWAAIFVVAVPYMLVTSSGTHLAGAFIGYVALLGTIGIAAIVLIIFALSFLFRSSKNTLTAALVLLLAMATPALFSSTLKNNSAAQVLSRINPVDNIFGSLDNVLVDYQQSLAQNWHYLWPLLVFLLLAIILLIGAIRRFSQQGIIKNE